MQEAGALRPHTILSVCLPGWAATPIVARLQLGDGNTAIVRARNVNFSNDTSLVAGIHAMIPGAGPLDLRAPPLLHPFKRNTAGHTMIGAIQPVSAYQAFIWPSFVELRANVAVSADQAWSLCAGAIGQDEKSIWGELFVDGYRRVLAHDDGPAGDSWMKGPDVTGYPVDWGVNDRSEFSRAVPLALRFPGLYKSGKSMVTWSSAFTVPPPMLLATQDEARQFGQDLDQSMTDTTNLLILSRSEPNDGIERQLVVKQCCQSFSSLVEVTASMLWGESVWRDDIKGGNSRPGRSFPGAQAAFVRLVADCYERHHAMRGLWGQFRSELELLALWWDNVRNPETHRPELLVHMPTNLATVRYQIGRDEVQRVTSAALSCATELIRRAKLFPTTGWSNGVGSQSPVG